MEDALSFECHCLRCVVAIPPGSGYVLSCGDIFCSTCGQEIRNICPFCGSKDVQSVHLRDAPSEVSVVFMSPAQELQTLFDSLKFQIQHYKAVLKQENYMLKEMDRERQQLIKKCSDLTSQVDFLSKKQQSQGSEAVDEPPVQPKVFWKSGPNKSENLFLQSTKQPSDHFKRDEIPTTPSSLTRRSATGTPLPMPSPNKGFTQRPITPNSPLVEIQRKRKYQNVNVVSSPKYTPSTPVDYEEGRSTPKPTPRSSNSHRPISSPLPASRLRSPYLPYIRSSGKVSNPPPT